MGLIDWLTSDWTTIESLIVTDVRGHDCSTVVLDTYEAKVQEHDETGERRIARTRDRGKSVHHGLSPEDVPPVIQGETMLTTEVLYRRDYVEDKYDIE